jgi:hypothetical protein
MNYRKVYGGTPQGNESRCDTCLYVRLIKGYAESERIVICDRYFEPIRITFKVYECSDYANRNLPDVDEMEKIAWELRPNERPGRKAGFISPQEKLLLAQEDEE